MVLNIIGEEVDIFVYERDQMFIPSEMWIYGSDKKRIFMKSNVSYQYQYHVFQDDVITLDQPAQRCHEPDNRPNISTCLSEYIRRKFNCVSSLPLLGNHGVMGKCGYNDTVDALEFKLFLALKTETEIFQETGCMPSCNRKQIKLELISSREFTGVIPAIWIWLGYRDALYSLNKEYLVFDNDSLLADIGGYLGLMWGFSIFSIFQQLETNLLNFYFIIKQWFKKKTKQGSDTTDLGKTLTKT